MGEAPSLEALRLEYEWLTKRVGESREDLRAITQQVVAAMATGALLIGLFAAFRPEDPSGLTSALFLVSLVPFVTVAMLSLWGDWAVQTVKTHFKIRREHEVRSAKMKEVIAQQDNAEDLTPLDVLELSQTLVRRDPSSGPPTREPVALGRRLDADAHGQSRRRRKGAIPGRSCSLSLP
jgi:hypothetical protein